MPGMPPACGAALLGDGCMTHSGTTGPSGLCPGSAAGLEQGCAGRRSAVGAVPHGRLQLGLSPEVQVLVQPRSGGATGAATHMLVIA